MRRFLWLLFLLLLPLTACAETYSVSPEGLSITEALSQCASGDVIELTDGVYDETQESFPLTVDQAVTIRAAEGAAPVIDAPAFKAALERFKAEGFERINPSILKSTIQADYPNFDERTIGFKRFSDVMKELEKQEFSLSVNQT